MDRRNTTQRNLLPAFGLFLFLAFGIAATCAATQTPQSTAPAQPSLAEYNSLAGERQERDPQARIKLLDQFLAQFPQSDYLPYAYMDYYQLYMQMQQYPEAVAWADKLLALDQIDRAARLSTLIIREMAYTYGCSDPALQGADAAAKAQQAAAQGQELLAQLPGPAHLSDEQFATAKSLLAQVFVSAANMADARVNGESVACPPPPPPPAPGSSAPPVSPPAPVAPPAPPPPPGQTFDSIIEELLNEQRQSPPVHVEPQP